MIIKYRVILIAIVQLVCIEDYFGYPYSIVLRALVLNFNRKLQRRRAKPLRAGIKTKEKKP